MNLKLSFLLVIGSLCLSFPALAQWTLISSAADHWPLNYIEVNNGKLFGCGNSGVFSSTDGSTWTDLTQGFASSASTSNRGMAFAGTNIYVRSTTEPMFSSSDGGTTWAYDSAGLSVDGGGELDMVYFDGTHVYTSHAWPGYGLFYKTPAATSWTRVNSNGVGSAAKRVVGFTHVGTKSYALTTGGTLYESTDHGVNWTQVTATGLPSLSGPAFCGNSLITVGTDMYIGGNGVHRSTDGGATWTRIDKNFSLYFGGVYLMSLYANAGKLYASVGNEDTVYVSSDNGATWADMSDGDGLSSKIISMAWFGGRLLACQFGQDSLSGYGPGSGTGFRENDATINSGVKIQTLGAGKFSIISEQASKYQNFRIYNMNGRVIYRDVVTDRNEVDLSNQPKGIYIFELQGKHAYRTKVLVD